MLKIINLQVAYGPLRVVHGASLHVAPGEAVALIGANGAGKSSLLNAVAGLVPAVGGRVLLAGREVTGRSAERIARAGITLVPEGRGLFPGMSVLDNLRMGGYAKRFSRVELNRRVEASAALFPALQERLAQKAGTLSGGQQQMLAIARALVGEPQVLLLDEPSTGLAPRLVAEIFGTLVKLKAAGLPIILAEQHVREALELADRGYVMANGRIVAEGTSAELLASGEIQKAYLGM